MTALMDVWHAIQAVATSADYYTLGAAIIIILAAGFLMEGVRSVVPATLLALIVFALVKAGLALALGTVHDVDVLATDTWKAFVDLKMLVLLAHALIFGVLMIVVNVIRSAVR